MIFCKPKNKLHFRSNLIRVLALDIEGGEKKKRERDNLKILLK